MKEKADDQQLKRALIFCNGEFSAESVPDLKTDDLVICADGGLEHALALGIKPHVVLGDFDSLSEALRRRLRDKDPAVGAVYEYPVEKDKTDGQIAVEYAVNQGIREIWLLGGLGGRLDHALGNVLLGSALGFEGTLKVLGRGESAVVVKGPGKLEISGGKGDHVSLIPLSETCSGVTTAGLYYPLKDEILYRGDTRGLSNELISHSGLVELAAGLMIVIHTKRQEGLVG
ncbi:MAG: thiamine diphosphokinase [Firmicutes bacterium]|nr:thiamine diphosphokinase [Bacillota bacterium]